MQTLQTEASQQNFEDDYETYDKIHINFSFSISSINENQSLIQLPEQNKKPQQRSLQIQPFIQFEKSGKLKLNFRIVDLSNPNNNTIINSDINIKRKSQAKNPKEQSINSQSNSSNSPNNFERKANQYSNQDQFNTENQKNLSPNQSQIQQQLNLSTYVKQEMNVQIKNILNVQQIICDKKSSKKMKKNEEKSFTKQMKSFNQTVSQQTDTEEMQNSISAQEKQYTKHQESPYKKKNQSSVSSNELNQQQLQENKHSDTFFGLSSDRIKSQQQHIRSKFLNQNVNNLNDQSILQFESKFDRIQSDFAPQFPYKVESDQSDIQNEQYQYSYKTNPNQYNLFNTMNQNNYNDSTDQYSYKNEVEPNSQKNDSDQQMNKNELSYYSHLKEANKYPHLNLSKISMTEQIKQESIDNIEIHERQDKDNFSCQQSKNDTSEKNTLLNLSSNIIENNDQSQCKFSQGQSGAETTTVIKRTRRNISSTPKSLSMLPLMNEIQKKKQNTNINISNKESSPSHQKGIAVNMAKNLLKGFMEYIFTTAKEEDLIEYCKKQNSPTKIQNEQPSIENLLSQEEQEQSKSKQEKLALSKELSHEEAQESIEVEEEERSNQKDENDDDIDQQDIDSEEKNQFDSDDIHLKEGEDKNKKSIVESIRKRFKKHYNSKMLEKPSNTKLLKLFQNNSFGNLFKHYISSDEIMNYIQTSNIQSKNVHKELIEKIRATSYDFEKIQDILKTRVIKKYPYSKPLE